MSAHTHTHPFTVTSIERCRDCKHRTALYLYAYAALCLSLLLLGQLNSWWTCLISWNRNITWKKNGRALSSAAVEAAASDAYKAAPPAKLRHLPTTYSRLGCPRIALAFASPDAFYTLSRRLARGPEGTRPRWPVAIARRPRTCCRVERPTPSEKRQTQTTRRRKADPRIISK